MTAPGRSLAIPATKAGGGFPRPHHAASRSVDQTKLRYWDWQDLTTQGELTPSRAWKQRNLRPPLRSLFPPTAADILE